MSGQGARCAAGVALILAAGLAGTGVLAAGPTSGAREVRYTARFDPADLELGRMNGYDTLALPEREWLAEPGRPRLPVRTVRLALPPGMAVAGLRIGAVRSMALAGEFAVFPAQSPRPVSAAEPFARVAPDPAVYGGTAAYPGALAEFVQAADLAGQPLAVLRLQPVHYSPAHKKITLYTSVEVILDCVPGYRCGDALPAGLTAAEVAERTAAVRELVVNPDAVALAPPTQPAGPRGVGPGDYDYVVIVPDGWEAGYAPLVQWKTRKGVPATLVTTGWIMAAYAGSSPEDRLRAFVQDAYANWGTRYVLLGGDSNVVGYHLRYVLDEWLPNDTYYADFDDDWICEMHVGRAPVRTAAEIPTFVNKVLTYEQNPPASDYARTAAFFGFDLYTYGSCEGEACKEAIRTLSIPADWTYRYEYDKEPGSHWANVMGYLNQGSHLVNHVDHGGTDYMGTGCTVHGEGLCGADMSSLYNGARQGIGYSIGCWCCDFPAEVCIAEAFVRNPAGGGLAFIGNSRFGWYMPFEGYEYSLTYDQNFYQSLLEQGHYALGEAYSDHKNDSPTDNDWYKYIFTSLTLLGDPELPVLTEDPLPVSAAHPGTLALEPSPFSVSVQAAGGPLAGARVCLWKPDDVYLVQDTDASGVATFEVDPATTGSMNVTVFRRNYYPYQGQAQVLAGEQQIVAPSGLTVVRGKLVGGSVADLAESDDAAAAVQAGLTIGSSEPPIWLVLTGTAPTASPAALSFTLEARVSTPGVITQRLWLFNYLTQAFEQVDARPATLSDTAVIIAAFGDLSRFVEPDTREVQAQLTWKPAGPVLVHTWQAVIDQAVWTVTP